MFSAPGPGWMRPTIFCQEARQKLENAPDGAKFSMFSGKASPGKQRDELDAEFERY